jgi:hypothetical protein
LAISDDITPKITEVRFENIGEVVVAKIAGSSMWFVYNVTIEGVNGDGRDLKVDVISESEVQTRMREANITHDEQVCVRVKTHFQNSKYLQQTRVPAKTTVCIFCIFPQKISCLHPQSTKILILLQKNYCSSFLLLFYV